MRSTSRDKSRSRSSSSQSTVKPILEKSNNPITKGIILFSLRGQDLRSRIDIE